MESSFAKQLVETGIARGMTVSTAESCTAGMVASLIADIPGASEVLRGGAVTYCDDIKHQVLGVSIETLDRFTAVSMQTAQEMAQGSRQLFSSTVAVSLTGYAGPGGGTSADPAGTVYIGIDSARGTRSHRYVFQDTRNVVREQSALEAIKLVIAEFEML